MKLTFLGAAREVTGSCTLLEAAGHLLMIDCGMEQGKDVYQNVEWPVAPARLDALLLTHAHIDHSGQVPYLYKNGYRGPIYATDATDYAAGGRLYQWDPSGTLIGSWGVYVNPAHFVALPPDGMHFGGVDDILADKPVGDSTIYNLQGIPVANPVPGQVYIRDGHKFIKM